MNAPARRCAALLALCLAACGGEPSITPNTFACGPTAAAVQCAYNTQYCLETAPSGTVTASVCAALPTGCTEAPCDSCLSAARVPNRRSCVAFRTGSDRAIEVQVSR